MGATVSWGSPSVRRIGGAAGSTARDSRSIARVLRGTVTAVLDMRIDKWLFVARFFKSRTLAADACEGGKVDVNGQAAKPARAVRPGDRLDISLPAGRRVARIAGLAPRRGSGADARQLYEDL